MGIAVSAAAAFSDQHPLIGFGEVVEHFAGLIVDHDRTDRDFDFKILAVAAMAIAAFAVTASFGAKGMVEAKFQESVFVNIGREVDAAAVAAVTATGSALGDELLSAEGDAAMTAVTGFDCDFGFVDEHRYGHKDKKAPGHNEGRRLSPLMAALVVSWCLCVFAPIAQVGSK